MHYFRTTNDGRIVFGWGGGPFAFGARLGGRVERDATTVERTAAHLREFFPQLEGRALTHAWGGPIDVSPSHLPQVGTLEGAPVHYAFGFTGNGVGPSPPRRPHPRGARDAASAPRSSCPPATRRPSRPSRSPGPAAWSSAPPSCARSASRPRAAAPTSLTRAVCAAPKALGIHVSALIRCATEWCTSASPSFFSSPLGGNSAWRPRSREPS